MQDDQQIIYPITANAGIVDKSGIEDFMQTLFSRVLWRPDHFINLRGIGEKGTPREGKFHADEWIQPGLEEFPDDHMTELTIHHAKRWAQHHIAAFVVPAVMKAARGTSENVGLMVAVVLDLDTGDTNAKAAWIDQHIGPPTIVVASGGITEVGTPKLHLYWVLDDPTDDVAGVVALRHLLAEKIGGDLQFGRGTPDNPLGRAHQPIRIGGSVHAKHGRAAPVRVLWTRGPMPEVGELGWRIRQAPESPWAVRAHAMPAAGGFDFGPTKNCQPMSASEMLVAPIQEGGDGPDSRWGRFSAVAGHHISLVRRGELSIDQAKAETYGWMLSKMVPPWPDARFEREWHGLLQHDIRAKGEMRAPDAQTAEQLEAHPERIRIERRLENWAVHLWTQEKAPPREFIVRGLVQAAKPHLFVAEGGAGKTFATLDLALKVASRGENEALLWMGLPIERSGTVVVLTTEDDRDELHLRMEELDPDGRRFRAGRRLVVMPTLNSGGGFTMAERKRDGSVGPTRDWAELQAQLRLIPDLVLVVIDTLNSTLHGDENSATVINEYVRMIQPVCGELNAALLLTHHIRKQGNQAGGVQRPIISSEDMFNAIRGSSALPASFRVVLGMWHCHDFRKKMGAAGLAPEDRRLWKLGVLKANNPEMARGVRYLLRDDRGMVQDATDIIVSATTSLEAQQRAWLVLAVKVAAEAGTPFKLAKKDSSDGIYGRKGKLPEILAGREVGPDRLEAMVQRLVDDRSIVVCKVPWRDSTRRQRDFPTLDVPGGQYTADDPPTVDAGLQFKQPEWERIYRFDDVYGGVVPIDAPVIELRQAEREG